MNKRHLHHVWRYIRHVHPWYFLIIGLIFGAISLNALRANNEQMIVLRDAVYEADKNNGDVEGAIKNLREHVYAHMNTSLTSGSNAVHPPIQLKYAYERAQVAQQVSLGPGRSDVYFQAQQYCEAQSTEMSAPDVISCIESFTAARGVQLGTIPDGLYKFDFTSAKWSPDLAGWTLVLAIFAFILFLATAVYRWVLKKILF